MIERIFLNENGQWRPHFYSKGRLTPKGFLKIAALCIGLPAVLLFPLMLSNLLALMFLGSGVGVIFLVLWALLLPIILYVFLAATARRLHDVGRPGTWAFLLPVIAFIPYISFLALAAVALLVAMPGTVGPNRYGVDPIKR